MLNLKEKIKFIIMTCERWGANFYYEEASQRPKRPLACMWVFFFCQTHECVYIYILFFVFFAKHPFQRPLWPQIWNNMNIKLIPINTSISLTWSIFHSLLLLWRSEFSLLSICFQFSPLASIFHSSLILILSNFIQSFQVSLFLLSFSNFCFQFLMLIYVNFYFLSRFSLLSICILSFPLYQ